MKKIKCWMLTRFQSSFDNVILYLEILLEGKEPIYLADTEIVQGELTEFFHILNKKKNG